MSVPLYSLFIALQQLLLLLRVCAQLDPVPVPIPFPVIPPTRMPASAYFPPPPTAEMAFLQEFYDSTGGANWDYDNQNYDVFLTGPPWNFTGGVHNPCSEGWHGLACAYNSSVSANNSHVAAIRLHNMSLVGTIPSSVSNLEYLELFFLANNANLTGPIPSSLGAITTLKELTLFDNRLTGTLPDSLGKLSNLEILDFGANRNLHGPIPPGYGNLSQMQHFLLWGNALTGTLIDFYFPQATLLYLSANLFEGSLPESIMKSTSLISLFIASNGITGTIPSSIVNLHQLFDLNLQRNALSGSIPPGMFENMPLLAHFSFSNNQLTGTVDNSIGTCTLMHDLLLANNMLSGTIPSVVSSLNRLLDVELHNNLFSGSIPSSIGNLSKVTGLSLQKNRLTGTIPASARNLQSLISFLIYDNHISGEIDNIFDPDTMISLNTIDISNNHITGSLPEAVFKLPSLVGFYAAINCLQGPLPDNICSGNQLQSLILDGMRTAHKCQLQIFPGISYIHSYLLEGTFDGSIPRCLYNMPQLQMLHMAGNWIEDSIPSDVVISDSLLDLSLSFNLLHGTIPHQIQERKWVTLDLSFNNFNGSLSEKFAEIEPGSAVDLLVNRLSGDIPKSFRNALNVSILQGNLFSCDFSRTDLPEHDRYNEEYECGSNEFEVSYLLWILLCVLIASWRIATLRLHKNAQRLLQMSSSNGLSDDGRSGGAAHRAEDQTKNTSSDSVPVAEYFKYSYETVCKCLDEPIVRNSSIGSFLNIRIELQAVCFIIALLMIVFLLPLYVLLHLKYDLFSNPYAWRASTAYLGGHVPALILLSVWLVSIGASVYYVDEVLRGIDLQNHPYLNAFVSKLLPLTAFHSPFVSNSRKRQENAGEPVVVESDTMLDSKATVFTEIRDVDTTNRSRADTGTGTDSIGQGSLSGSTTSIGATTTTTNRFQNGRRIRISIMLAINFIVVFIANAGYVYISYNFASTIVLMTQITMALFKIGWNFGAIPLMFRWFRSHYAYLVEGNKGVVNSRETASARYSTATREAIKDLKWSYIDLPYQLFAVVVNSVGIPCLVVLFVNPQCLYYMINDPPRVKYSYSYPVCLFFVCNDVFQQEVSNNFLPPFSYSYSCSSRFLTAYAAIYIYIFIITGFVRPLCLECLRFLYVYTKNGGKEEEQEGRAATAAAEDVSISGENTSVMRDHLTTADSSTDSPTPTAWKTKFYHFLEMTIPEILQTPGPGRLQQSMLQLLRCEAITIKIVHDLVILLTYGLAFPPLGLVIVVEFFFFLLYEQFKIARALYLARKNDVFGEYLDILDKNCSTVIKQLKHSSGGFVGFFSFSYFAFFIFDMYGVDAGWRVAVGPSSIMVLFPVLFYLSRKLYVVFDSGKGVSSSSLFLSAAGNDSDGKRNTSVVGADDTDEHVECYSSMAMVSTDIRSSFVSVSDKCGTGTSTGTGADGNKNTLVARDLRLSAAAGADASRLMIATTSSSSSANGESSTDDAAGNITAAENFIIGGQQQQQQNSTDNYC